MEPQYYQGMEFEVAQISKGVRYQNLWYINKRESLIDCAIQFYLCWGALRIVVENVPHLSEEGEKNIGGS